MPGSDTSNLPQTSMGLPRQLFGSPPGGHTFSSMTFSDSNAVDVLVHSKNVGDWDLLFKESSGEIDLVGAVSSVDLKFNNVSLLLFQREQFHLGMGNQSDGAAVLLDLGQVSLNGSSIGFPLFGSFRKRLLLRVGVVSVESAFELVRDVLGPDGFEGTESSGGFDVADYTDSNHWWGFDDGDWLDDLLFVEFGSLTGDLSDDVGHTGFVTNKSSQVARFALVILGVGLDSAEMPPCSFPGEEPFGPVSGCFEFSVRHVSFICKFDLRL